ncbi:MAG: hypothetical protein IIY06_03500 [Proteobacteria bacterium]|nr:hypothetical protein [Pseudomonadota bacterium]
MKKILLGLGAIAMLSGLTACGNSATVTTARGGLVRGSFEEANIAAKDFEPVSLVFTEITVDSKSGAFLSYDALLKEARKVGGHAIINVVIEDVVVCESSAFSSDCKTTRYGSALAIKYKEGALAIEQRVSRGGNGVGDGAGYISDPNATEPPKKFMGLF